MKKALLSLATLAAVVGGVVTVPAAATAAGTETLAVDFSAPTGEFRGGATGTLYGLGDTGAPTQALINGARITNTSQKAPFGTQHPSGDSLKIEDGFFAKNGKELDIYVQDYYPDWAYNGGQRPGDDRTYNQADGTYTAGGNGIWDYLEVIEFVTEAVATQSSYPDKYVFIPFNEPDGGNWYNNFDFFKQNFLTDWKAAYDKIHEVYARHGLAAPVIGGPGDAAWHADRTAIWLDYVKATDTIPEFMIWHELGIDNLATYRSHYAEYRQLELERGISPLQINITEYGLLRDMSVPGQLIQWFAMFEDTKVDAQTAYWNYAGNLSDNSARTNAANAGWWMFKWYGDLAGSQTVAVTPPQLNVADTLQGIGAVDTANARATVLYGGSSASTVSLDLSGLDPQVFGENVDVEVREAPLSGAEGLSATPRVISVSEGVALSDGSLDLDVANYDRYAGYQVVITPQQDRTLETSPVWSASVEAESTQITGAQVYEQSPTASGGWNFLASGSRDVGSFNNASSKADWTVEVPRDGKYRFQVIGATPGTPGRHALFVDGTKSTTVQYTADLALNNTSRWKYRGSAEVVIDLTAGSHVLSLRASEDGATVLANADITLDKFTLTDVTAGEPTAYPSSVMRLAGGAQLDYSSEGSRGAAVVSGDGRADVYATAWDSGYYDVAVHYASEAATAVTIDVNGRRVAEVSAADAGDWISTARLHLSQGINEIEIRSADGALVKEVRTTRVTEADTAAVRIEAEAGTVAGTARKNPIAATTGTNASGGTNVDFVGNGAGNTLTIPRAAGFDQPGLYDIVVVYSNAELSGRHDYNPQVVDRRLQVNESGSSASAEAYFRYTYSWNSFWERTIPVELTTADGALVFGNASAYAPNLDYLVIAPVIVGTPTTVSAINAAPVISAATTPAPNAAGWNTGAATVVATATDDSGVAPTVTYSVDGAAAVESAAGVQVTGDGTHAVTVVATDAAGTGATQVVTVSIDGAKPVVTATADPSARTVTAAATDATSGVASLEFSLDAGATWAPYTAPIAASAARTEVWTRATDVAGNVSVPSSVVVDAVSAGAIATIIATTDPGAGGWYRQNVLLQLAVPAGVTAKIQYRVAGGAWKTYSKSISLSTAGENLVDHRLLRDAVVVPGTDGTATVRIDKTAPKSTVLSTPSTRTGSPRNPVTLQLSATDAHSGVQRVEYRIGTGAWTEATAAVPFAQVGDSVVTYRAVDAAGNTETERSITVRIAADPTTKVTLSAKKVKAGEFITISVAGYERWDFLSLTLGDVRIGQVYTDANGSAKITLKVPADTAAATLTLTASGSSGAPTATVPLVVVR